MATLGANLSLESASCQRRTCGVHVACCTLRVVERVVQSDCTCMYGRQLSLVVWGFLRFRYSCHSGLHGAFRHELFFIGFVGCGIYLFSSSFSFERVLLMVEVRSPAAHHPPTRLLRSKKNKGKCFAISRGGRGAALSHVPTLQ